MIGGLSIPTEAEWSLPLGGTSSLPYALPATADLPGDSMVLIESANQATS